MRPDVLGGGGPQPVGEDARDREQGDDGDGSRHRGARQPAAQGGAEQRADQAAGDRGDDRSDQRLGKEVRGPGERHRDLGPAPLGGEADGADQQARGRAEGQRPAGEREARQLDAGGLGEVEGQVRGGLPEQVADDQADPAADGDEEGGGGERAAAPDPEAGADQGHRGGDREQHRLEHEAELGHAEVELRLEGREADQEAAHQADAAQPDDQGGLGGRARRRAPGRRAPASPRPAARPGRSGSCRRPRSASGGWGPRGSRPGRTGGARRRRAGSRAGRRRRRRRSGGRRRARTSRRRCGRRPGRDAPSAGRSPGSRR